MNHVNARRIKKNIFSTNYTYFRYYSVCSRFLVKLISFWFLTLINILSLEEINKECTFKNSSWYYVLTCLYKCSLILAARDIGI